MKRIRGRVLAVDGSKATIITPAGEFLEVPVNAPVCVGSEILVDMGQDKKIPWSRFGTFAAAAAVALLVLTQSVLPGLARPAYYMHVDINPSVELGISDDHRVLFARGLNTDGSRLLLGTRVERQPVDKAVGAIIRRAEELSFLTPEKENTVMVSLLAEKPASENELETIADDVLNDLASTLEEDNIPGTAAVAAVGKEVRERASEKKISANKVLMAQTDRQDTGKPESIRKTLDKAFKIKEIRSGLKRNAAHGKGLKDAAEPPGTAPGHIEKDSETRKEQSEKQGRQPDFRQPRTGGSVTDPKSKDTEKQTGPKDRRLPGNSEGSRPLAIPDGNQPPGLIKDKDDKHNTGESIREQRDESTDPGKQWNLPGHLRRAQ